MSLCCLAIFMMPSMSARCPNVCGAISSARSLAYFLTSLSSTSPSLSVSSHWIWNPSSRNGVAITAQHTAGIPIFLFFGNCLASDPSSVRAVDARI